MISYVYGENSFMIREIVRTMTLEYTKEHGDFGLEILDASEIDIAAINLALTQIPFLVTKKLVIMSEGSALQPMVESIEPLIRSLPEEIDVVITDAKPDKRTKLFKLLLPHARECLQPKGTELVRWVAARARHYGGQIDVLDAEYLIERTGTDQNRIDTDLQVLTLSADESVQPVMIDRASIDNCVAPLLQASIFDVIEAVFSGRQKLAEQRVRALLTMGVQPLEILAMIGWQLHILAIMVAGRNISDADVARQSKIHPYVLSKSRTVSRRLDKDMIERFLGAVAKAEDSIKTSSLSDEDVLRVLILELSGATL
jgi:DNA polymerase III subunit delta